MSKIKVNKPDSAKRQINLASKLLFNEEDPIGIHTIAMAGFPIVRDLAKDIPDHQLEDSFSKIIKPGMEGEFWAAINRPSNFFKHAEKDPYEILSDVEETLNDSILFLASMWYQELGYELTPEMKALISWVSVLHPSFIRDEGSLKELVNRPEIASIRNEQRSEQLKVGKMVLDLAREPT